MKTRRKKSVDQQLKAYSTTAEAMRSKPGKSWLAYTAAAGAALTMAPSADAAPIYSGPQNINISTNGSAIVTAQLDLDGNAVFDFKLYLNRSTLGGVGTAANASLSTVAAGPSLYLNRILAASASGYYAKKLGAGAIISAGAGNFTSYFAGLRSVTSSGVYGQWNPSQNAFAGVRFRIGTADHFGWIRIHVGDQDGVPNSVTAIDWAYESVAEAAIHAGDTGQQVVPEPGTLALLASGAAGLLAWRRHRKPPQEG